LWIDEATWEHKDSRKVFWEEDRPDKCGVMFHPAGQEFTEATGIPVMVARGDFQRGQGVLSRMAQRALLILVVDDKKRQLMGTEEAIKAAQGWMFQEINN
jgi:hypothetical protein